MEKREKPHKDLSEYEGAYKAKCPCGKEHVIFSQPESFYCEYEHDVWVECKDCKGLAHFVISVN